MPTDATGRAFVSGARIHEMRMHFVHPSTASCVGFAQVVSSIYEREALMPETCMRNNQTEEAEEEVEKRSERPVLLIMNCVLSSPGSPSNNAPTCERYHSRLFNKVAPSDTHILGAMRCAIFKSRDCISAPSPVKVIRLWSDARAICGRPFEQLHQHSQLRVSESALWVRGGRCV